VTGGTVVVIAVVIAAVIVAVTVVDVGAVGGATTDARHTHIQRERERDLHVCLCPGALVIGDGVRG